MKILFINSVCGVGSTGRICTDLAQQLEKDGNEVKIAYGRTSAVPDSGKKYAIRIGNDLDCRIHALQTRLFDKHGFGSKSATKKFLKWVEIYQPDVIWLHNIHGYYINIEMLFEWIKAHPQLDVKWTLHDCWAFTGHCSHFSYVKCEQWKHECHRCVQLREYPACYLRGSVGANFERKRKAFTGVKNMRLITPSKWLADLTRESFLKEYPVEVHYNNIDTKIFKPTPNDFRQRYRVEEKNIVLGVANVWNERKGLYDFYKLADILPQKYVIVLVGVNGKQIKKLPKNIIGIQRTHSPQELAKIYTAADVFVNLTYEDNYPTVNLEAQACGKKVITYDTGGCRETLYTENSEIIKTGEIQEVARIIEEKI